MVTTIYYPCGNGSSSFINTFKGSPLTNLYMKIARFWDENNIAYREELDVIIITINASTLPSPLTIKGQEMTSVTFTTSATAAVG